jgi:hypothetical protein
MAMLVVHFDTATKKIVRVVGGGQPVEWPNGKVPPRAIEEVYGTIQFVRTNPDCVYNPATGELWCP